MNTIIFLVSAFIISLSFIDASKKIEINVDTKEVSTKEVDKIS